MMEMLVVIVAFAVSFIVTRQICNPASWLHVLDYPNERSLHTRAVPRTGGVAMLSGITVAGLLYLAINGADLVWVWVAVATFVVAVVSFIDDRQGLPVWVRLFSHVGSAVLVVASGLTVPGLGLPGTTWSWPVSLGVTVSVLYLVWMTNLYNFMDGMDGLAGGMAVIGFGALAVLGVTVANPAFVAVNLAIAAAAAAFLVFNFPPARVFMGDSGSATLGILAGSISIWGARDSVFPFWVPLLVFSPFIVDATVTLIRRLLRGEWVWQAHKSHYYQRLVQCGWGHRKTAIVEYGLMLTCAASAVVGAHIGTCGQWLILIGWFLIIYPGLMLLVSKLTRRATTHA
jgi:UDP-N-acetylmuramyl pentapeptide phosphotransferase/UDP-N-acetylglucosamine-1-phosphate transferase